MVLALLCAQWAGLLHRVEHAGWMPQAALQTNHADEEYPTGNDPHELNHSCALFDGILLADSAPLLPIKLPLLPGTRFLALWSAYASWDAPLLCHFSSRAPPSV